MKTFLVVLIFLCGLPCSALRYDFQVGGIYYLIRDSINEKTVYATSNIKSGSEPMGPYKGEVTIPPSVEWRNKRYRVIGLFGTFWNCPEVTSVKLPYGMEIISTFSFRWCGIRSIEIPQSVKVLGDRSFSCSELTSVSIPSSVKEIQWGAFSASEELKSVNLPKDLKILGPGAFADCSSLEEIIIPPNITKIESGLFASCVKLRKIELPPGIVSIGSEAFTYCERLFSKIGRAHV